MRRTLRVFRVARAPLVLPVPEWACVAGRLMRDGGQ
jgi:hypothetical protein